jgi:hypothetical protein
MLHFPNTESNIFYLWFHLMTLATPQTIYMEVLESSHISQHVKYKTDEENTLEAGQAWSGDKHRYTNTTK